MKVIAKIEEVPCLDGSIVYSCHGYIGEDKIVHNLDFPRTYPDSEYIAKCEKRWNSEQWQEKNKTNSFLRKITPRSVLWTN